MILWIRKNLPAKGKNYLGNSVTTVSFKLFQWEEMGKLVLAVFLVFRVKSIPTFFSPAEDLYDSELAIFLSSTLQTKSDKSC